MCINICIQIICKDYGQPLGPSRCSQRDVSNMCVCVSFLSKCLTV